MENWQIVVGFLLFLYLRSKFNAWREERWQRRLFKDLKGKVRCSAVFVLCSAL
jgi:hypothetical protein